VLAAAAVAGVDRVFTLGGAQAIAALAYGTATIPAVHKITGPGNAYVRQRQAPGLRHRRHRHDRRPSEILVLADGTTPPDWVAMDLFSQAEHDELAQSILLSPDAAYLERVGEAIDRLLPQMPRRDVIRASLEGRGAFILTRSMEEACEISNRIAPEHLEVSTREPQRWEPLLRHAGAIFLGAFTSESLGDYCAGPNHVLPTAGTARFSSPLGVYDFQKRTSLIEVSEGRGPGAGADRLCAGARRRAARPRPRGRDAVEQQAGKLNCRRPTMTPLAARIDRHVRQDVKSIARLRDSAERGHGQARRDGEPVSAPARPARRLGERLGQVAINRYPTTCVGDVIEALARHVELPEGCRLMLGNGSDELISLLAMACDVPGASIVAPLPLPGFVMYEMSARLQGPRLRGACR
jgi:hypothetical protein